MDMNSANPFWNFFASVKLALFTLGCLAITSIIGTIIPQNEPLQFYINQYGAKTATYFQLLDFTDMYASWWFLTLLGLLSVNLIVCSINRFPVAWKLISQDYLQIPLERIRKFNNSCFFTSKRPPHELTTELYQIFKELGWKIKSTDRDGTLLFFSQKMAWSRIGVYLVHLSILVIFGGAAYGQINGFRGSIMLPELQSSDTIFSFQNSAAINLGFTLRCDRFETEFYENSMVKEYRSRLTILENDQMILTKDIEVNTPLKYKGITIYQASYQPFNDFLFSISEAGQEPVRVTGQFEKELRLPGQDIRFGIINMESIRDQAVRLKIWFNDPSGPPSEFWMKAGEEIELPRGETTYLFSAKQRYATGLQVAKDPGVWIVYIGFTLMIGGLYIAFFMSHQRVWLMVRVDGQETRLELRGTANKNQTGFTSRFEQLTTALSKRVEMS